MKRATRVAAALFILIGSSFVFAEDTPPTLVWSEQGPGATGRTQSGNLYYCGGVFNDLFYTGQLSYGPLAYARTQSGDPATAMVHGFDIAELERVPPDTHNGARSAVVIGNYIFFNRTDKDPVAHPHPRLNRLNSDWTNNVAFDMGNNGGDVAPEGMTTDGTSLFTTQHTSKNIIRKYSITNQTTSFSLTKTLNVTVAGATTFRAISYYKGKLYVADNAGTKGIYEIDASTGAYAKLGTHIGNGAYQAVRYGNRLLVVDGADNTGGANNLTVYTIADGALSAGTPYNLSSVAAHVLGLYGIAVVGNDAEVTGFWVTSMNGWISFFSCSFSIVTCNRPFADADDDNDVDQDDFGIFQRCFLGTNLSVPAGPASNYFCACFDKDGINGVDSIDLGTFEACLTAPAVTWAPSENCP